MESNMNSFKSGVSGIEKAVGALLFSCGEIVEAKGIDCEQSKQAYREAVKQGDAAFSQAQNAIGRMTKQERAYVIVEWKYACSFWSTTHAMTARRVAAWLDGRGASFENEQEKRCIADTKKRIENELAQETQPFKRKLLVEDLSFLREASRNG